MRCFVATAEGGSLTSGAKRLGISLPTAVRTLQQLEESLGVVLLHRTTRRMALTAEGRTYLQRVRKILADVAEAEASLVSKPGALRGPLRVTAPVRFGELHVAGALMEFAAEHPGVELDFVLADRLMDFVEESIDLAVRIGHLVDSSLVARQVGTMRQVVVASPDRIREDGPILTPASLEMLPCILVGAGTNSRWTFAAEGARNTVPTRGRIRTNHIAAGVEACAAGLGYGCFLQYQVAELVEQGRLKVVLERFEPPSLPVSFVFANARLASLRLRALLDFLTPRISLALEALARS